jgi:ankyrin repeat protein
MDSEKLMDLGIETMNLNFKIEVESEVFYTPIMLAAVIGYIPNLELLFTNPRIDINACDEETGVNSFYLASMYGKGEAMRFLASKGIDILNKDLGSGNNALHVAVLR